ncbi:unnamed protein product [Sphagnum balticum]
MMSSTVGVSVTNVAQCLSFVPAIAAHRHRHVNKLCDSLVPPPRYYCARTFSAIATDERLPDKSSSSNSSAALANTRTAFSLCQSSP